jgi:predicted DNA-binding transcriptional regulator AlpA
MSRIKPVAPELTSLEKLYTPSELSEYLKFTVATLAQMRYTGTGPTFIKLGHQIRYRESDILAWMAARAKSRTAS